MATRTRLPQAWLGILALFASALTVGMVHGRTAVTPAADTKRESGIYLESGDTSGTGGKDEPTRLTAVMAQVTPEGLGASMATMGFKKPKMIKHEPTATRSMTPQCNTEESMGTGYGAAHWSTLTP